MAGSTPASSPILRTVPTPDDEELRRLASNCGGAFLTVARAMGKPWREDDDLLLADLGLPVPAPPNNATLTRVPKDPDDIARRALDFFGGSPGGGFQVWSLWPSLDLSSHGFSGGETPCMVRDAGGVARAAPKELGIEEVSDDAGMFEAWSVVRIVFMGGRVREPFWDARVLSDRYRVWIGRVDGRTVTTATAFMSDGYVGVYAVGTLPEARGRGYGEALTWAATLCRPDLPATLQASEMGAPIYERMGFRTVASFNVWLRDHRPE